jgi:glycosyltransferase involved in cell wall biosynthesis
MLHASGIGTYIRQLVPRVLGARPDLSFTLLGRADRAGAWPEAPGAHVTWVECDAPIYSLREQWAVPRRLPKTTDLLWVPHFNIPFSYRGPLLVTVHDLFHLAQPRFAGRLWRRWAAQAYLHQVRRKASAVLVPSEFTSSEFRRLVGIPRAMAVTPLAADDSWEGRSGGPSPHAGPYFLFVGNVKPHKNLTGLIEAFSLIQERVPHDLVVVGQRDGFLLGDSRVAEQAASLGRRIRFTGAVDRNELGRWMEHAQALVLPSFYEGFGLPPLEAMRMGVPVVVSDRASLPEVCGDAALYVNPDHPSSIADALLRLAGDATLRGELARKGKERAGGFQWDETLRRTLPVLEACLGG